MAACLFPPYFVIGSVGFGHVLHIRSLASLAAASSDEKIRRLDFLIFKFEAEIYKFNYKFGSKATRRSIVR